MTRSVYVIGGAGAGKSTFMSQLLDSLEFGPLVDFHQQANRKALVTLRGHQLPGDGAYLGVKRDAFPGTDGLDRASSPVGAAWLREAQLPAYIVGEGATLATRPFLEALLEKTELVLVHLWVDPILADLRFLARGSSQDERFVANTVTRSVNLAAHMEQIGTRVETVDSGSSTAVEAALELCSNFLPKPLARSSKTS